MAWLKNERCKKRELSVSCTFKNNRSIYLFVADLMGIEETRRKMEVGNSGATNKEGGRNKLVEGRIFRTNETMDGH